MSRHRQPEAVVLQRQPKRVRGPEAGCESEAEPDHPVHADLRPLRRVQQARSQPSLLQPAGHQAEPPPLRLPGTPVHALLGLEQSRRAARLYGGGVGTPHRRRPGPAAQTPVARLGRRWRGRRPAETQAVPTGTRSELQTRQRRV